MQYGFQAIHERILAYAGTGKKAANATLAKATPTDTR
jgi:hypothetical protein